MEILELISQSGDSILYSEGEIIFNAGSVAEEMFVINHGEVDIVYNNKVLETLGPGNIFGEMALIDDDRRSATAMAKTNTQVIPIDKRKFDSLIRHETLGLDFALMVMKVLADRIRKTNYLLSK